MNPVVIAAGVAALILFLRPGGTAAQPTDAGTSSAPAASVAGDSGSAVALPPGEGGSSQGSLSITQGSQVSQTDSNIVSTYTAEPVNNASAASQISQYEAAQGSRAAGPTDYGTSVYTAPAPTVTTSIPGTRTAVVA